MKRKGENAMKKMPPVKDKVASKPKAKAPTAKPKKVSNKK
jgi:hypothetical protein